VKKFEDMHNRLDRIHACDGRTDGRTERHTSCDGIIRAMHTHRAINKLSYKHGRPKTDLGLLNIT